ncbi:Translocator protein [Carabus blaptoides fortunei]
MVQWLMVFSRAHNKYIIRSGYFTRKSIKTWYETLKKPEWRPPNWVFAPVWTSLYTGMGYASYLVYKEGGGFNGPAKLPLIAYGTQLALNWAWTPIFFGYKNVKWGFYAILALDVSVVTCGIMFAEVNKTAGLLFIPVYIA